jgi:inner membrane protein
MVAFGLAGAAPDLDLLVGAHSGPTHGLGAAAIVGLAAFLLTRRGLTAFAYAAAYATHILLDWLGSDTSPPIGIMALWPFSREYYESSLHLFMAISRRYWLPEFWRHNLFALARELMILAPVMGLALWLRARPSAR